MLSRYLAHCSLAVLVLAASPSRLSLGPDSRFTLVWGPSVVAAQDHAAMDHAAHTAAPAATNDSAFRALQQRGAGTMGVDQYASRHRFEDLPDGGRIELQMREADSTGVARIRAHLQQTVVEFRAGRFTAPEATHAMTVPGTPVMAAKQGTIRFTYGELPKGGEIRLQTSDPEALAAIREFLAFQRSDHRADP